MGESEESSSFHGLPGRRAFGRLPGGGLGLLLAAGFWTGVLGTGWSKDAVVAPVEVGQAGDWCTRLKASPGKVYSNPDNEWLQELKFFGRFHWNQAWVDGEAGGKDFWYGNGGEIRRFWLGTQATLFDAFTVHYSMQLQNDRTPAGGPRKVGYQNAFAAYVEWDLNKSFETLGGGNWKVGYGKRCLPLAEEVLDSSKFMPTVERSALSNRLFILSPGGVAPLGTWVRHKAGPWSSFFGMYSTDTAPDWGNWDDGLAWIAQTERDMKAEFGTDSAKLAVAAYYEDTKRGDDRYIGASMNWAVSAWTIIQQGPWTYRANLVFAEADSSNPMRDGAFWGFVGTVQRELIEDKLEAVGRYHYQGSQNPQGIQMYSRYARLAGGARNEGIPTLAAGRGDQQHSVYLGLNWKLCSHNIKLMSGVEWERLTSGSTEVYEGITYWLGLRSYF